MSGHSKWHNIQARKGKQDAKKSGQFTKLAKAIAVAAQSGADPATNFSLRIAVDKARAASMPKDNIDRAIKRGTGADGEAVQMEEVLYEAFGPSGVALLIKAVTDNKNRTLSDLKHMLNEVGGTFASAGSVQWMFGLWGLIAVQHDELAKASVDQESFEMELIDAGVEDIKDGEAGEVDIRTKVENFQKVVTLLRDKGITIKESGIVWIPKDTIPISKEIEEKLGELFAAFEEHGDIEDYYTNAN